jgi:hypothetical protein
VDQLNHTLGHPSYAGPATLRKEESVMSESHALHDIVVDRARRRIVANIGERVG